MTINLFSKLSSSLAVAAVLAAGPVFAIDSDSEDEFAHVPAPLVLGAGMPVIHAQLLTADFFETAEEQAKNNLGAAEEDAQEHEFAHVPAPLVLGEGIPVIRAQLITADLFQTPDQDAQGKQEQ